MISFAASPQISSIFQVESCRLQLKKGKKDKNDLEAWEKFKILGAIDINGCSRFGIVCKSTCLCIHIQRSGPGNRIDFFIHHAIRILMLA
jgi:hypothetical protein